MKDIRAGSCEALCLLLRMQNQTATAAMATAATAPMPIPALAPAERPDEDDAEDDWAGGAVAVGEEFDMGPEFRPEVGVNVAEDVAEEVGEPEALALASMATESTDQKVGEAVEDFSDAL
jgi:hypothetical protein